MVCVKILWEVLLKSDGIKMVKRGFVNVWLNLLNKYNGKGRCINEMIKRCLMCVVFGYFLEYDGSGLNE